jgi:hypothetical protein
VQLFWQNETKKLQQIQLASAPGKQIDENCEEFGYKRSALRANLMAAVDLASGDIERCDGWMPWTVTSGRPHLAPARFEQALR